MSSYAVLAVAVIVLAIVNLGIVWAWWATARRLDRAWEVIASLQSDRAFRARQEPLLPRVQFLEVQGQKLLSESRESLDMHEAAARFIVDHTERIMRLERGVVVVRGGRQGGVQ